MEFFDRWLSSLCLHVPANGDFSALQVPSWHQLPAAFMQSQFCLQKQQDLHTRWSSTFHLDYPSCKYVTRLEYPTAGQVWLAHKSAALSIGFHKVLSQDPSAGLCEVYDPLRAHHLLSVCFLPPNLALLFHTSTVDPFRSEARLCFPE